MVQFMNPQGPMPARSYSQSSHRQCIQGQLPLVLKVERHQPRQIIFEDASVGSAEKMVSQMYEMFFFLALVVSSDPSPMRRSVEGILLLCV